MAQLVVYTRDRRVPSPGPGWLLMPRPPSGEGWLIFDTTKDYHTGWLYIGELTSARV